MADNSFSKGVDPVKVNDPNSTSYPGNSTVNNSSRTTLHPDNYQPKPDNKPDDKKSFTKTESGGETFMGYGK